MRLSSAAASACVVLLLTVVPGAAQGQAQSSGGATAAPHPAGARNLEIHFDPASTKIHFRVSSLLRDVRGSFPLKGGALAVDPDSTLAQGELLVDATAGKTANRADQPIMEDQVLETKRYPAIFFHAEHVRGQVPLKDGSSDVMADGILNIHGADHPFQMRVHLVRQGDTLTATSKFSIPYADWGMRVPVRSVFRLSRTADVDVAAKASIHTVAVKQGTPSDDSDEESPRPKPPS